jgi:hypothetical protein
MLKKFSLGFIAFWQALGLVVYCGLVGLLIWRGNQWFGPVTSFVGPILFLSLFVVSTLICALLALGYPIVLFWLRKQKIEALKLVGYTSLWLLFFILLFIFMLLYF